MSIKHLARQDGCQAPTGTTDPKRGSGKLVPDSSTILLQTQAILASVVSLKGFTAIVRTLHSVRAHSEVGLSKVLLYNPTKQFAFFGSEFLLLLSF